MTASIAILGGRDGAAAGVMARYFVLQTQPAYYTKGGGEPTGQWFGGAAYALGLWGDVIEHPLTNVLSGRSPDGQRQLVQIQQQKEGNSKRSKRRDRAPGFDLTLSLPKSISVIYALGSVYTRFLIDQAMDRASKRIIEYIEKHLPMGRRGKGGATQETARLLVAFFDHAVNRRLEPQRHRHCVIANLCQLENGDWRTVNSPLLHKWTRTLGPMFRSEFAAELKNTLGIQLELPVGLDGKPKTAFEALGVPEDLCKAWSSRKAEIDEMIAGEDGSLGSTASAAAKQKAALESREAKPITPPREELYTRWQAEAAEFGYNQQDVEQLCQQALPVDHEQAYHTAKAEALSTLTAQQSDFSERQFIQKLFEAIQHQGVPMDFVLEQITQDLAQSPDLVRLNPRDNEWRFTTKDMWELEGAMLQDGDRLQAAKGATVSTAMIDDVLVKRPTIMAEQAKAVRDLLADQSALRVLTGVAGAGKSFALDAVREGLEAAGYHVLGGALAGVATEELATKANIPARTVASYLWHLGENIEFDDQTSIGKKTVGQSGESSRPKETPFLLNDRSVLIIDEFGMLPTKSAAALFRHAVKAAGATLILVGDDKQLQPCEAGAPLRYLMNSRPHAVLKENLRQQDPQDRQAVTDLRAGRATAALDNWSKRDRLVLGKNQTDAIRKLVRSWVQHGGRERPDEHLIFTQTRAEARAINRLCQQERQKAGLVDDKRQLTIGKQSFGKGDHVLFHRPISEQAIRNGYSGVVLRVNSHAQTITIRLANHRPDRNPVVTIPLSQIKADGIAGNHARTINKGQGQTVEHAYLLLGGSMTDRETVYTQGTRGKLPTKLFVDRLQAGEDLRDLAKAMEKSRAKGLAHDLGLRLEIEREQKR